MGFLKRLGGGLVDIATTLIPGQIDDAIVKNIRASRSSSSSIPLPSIAPQVQSQPLVEAPQPHEQQGFIAYAEQNARNDILGTLQQFSSGLWPVWLFNTYIDWIKTSSQTQRLNGGTIPPSSGNGGGGYTPTSVGSVQSTMNDILGSNKIVMAPEYKMVVDPPRGYVAVEIDGEKVVMLKSVARKLGLWRPRKKPPISASDWSKLKTAQRVENKAKRIAQTAGYKVTNK